MTEHAATYKELRRGRDDRMLGGVCSGLGHYFNVNPVFYRVGFVILTLLGGAGILVYGAAVLVIPSEGERDSIASDVLRNHRQHPLALVALAVVTVAGIALLSHLSFAIHSDTFWVLALIAGAFVLRSQHRRRPTVDPVPGAPTVVVAHRRSVFAVMFASVGALLLAAVIAVVAYGSFYLHLGDGVGNRSYEPLAASALRQDYRLGVGDLKLDLSRVHLEPGVTTVHARVGIGNLRVTVPPGVTVRAKAHVSWGEARLLGHDEGGYNMHSDVGSSHARLVLETDVGIGQVQVVRSAR